MKALIITILISFISLPGLNAQVELPENVENSFANFYPHIEDAHWEVNEKLQYEAHFKLNELPIIATFSINGQWLGERKYLAINDIPENIYTTLNTEYDAYTLIEVEEINSDMDITFYKIGLDRADGQWNILLSSDGLIVMEERVHERVHPWLNSEFVAKK